MLSDTRMGGNLRIIAWFWMVFSGGARAAIGSGRTVSQEPVRPARRLWQVVIGQPPVPPLDPGGAVGGHPGCGSNHAEIASDKLQMVDIEQVRRLRPGRDL